MTINAELNSSLDSKKVKPGDPVTARATETVKSSDGRTILPKGAKLIGRITQAKSRSKGDDESMLALQFDKAMLKEGQAVALSNVTIQAIAPPAASSSALSAGPPDTTSGAPTSPGANSPSNPSMSGSRGARPSPGTNESPYPNTGAERGGPNGSGPLPPSSKGVYGLEGLRLGVAATGNGETSVITSAGTLQLISDTANSNLASSATTNLTISGQSVITFDRLNAATNLTLLDSRVTRSVPKNGSRCPLL